MPKQKKRILQRNTAIMESGSLTESDIQWWISKDDDAATFI